MDKNKSTTSLLREHGRGFKIKLDDFEKFVWFISRWNTINFPFALFENKKDGIWFNEVLFGKELILTNDYLEVEELKYIIGTVEIGNHNYTVGTMDEVRDFDYHILTISDYTKYYIDKKNMLAYVVNLTYDGTDKNGTPRLMYSVPIDRDMLNCRSDIEFIKKIMHTNKINQIAYIEDCGRNTVILTPKKVGDFKVLNIRQFLHENCIYHEDVTGNWYGYSPSDIRIDKIVLPNVDLSGEIANIILSYERAGSHELYLYTEEGNALNISVDRPYVISSKARKSIVKEVSKLSYRVEELKLIESIKTTSKTH